MLRRVLGGRRRPCLIARLVLRALAGPARRHLGCGHPGRRDPAGRVFERLETAASSSEKTPEELGRLVAHLDLHFDDVGQFGNLVLQLGDAFKRVRERQRHTSVELCRQAGLRLAPTSSADGRHGQSSPSVRSFCGGAYRVVPKRGGDNGCAKACRVCREEPFLARVRGMEVTPTGSLLDADLGDRRQLPSRVVSAKVSLRNRFIEIWQARELVVFLIRKELKVRYKNSVLGFLWSFLNPALILCVYYVVFKYFLNNHISYFAIYLFAGLLPWNLFNNSLLSSAGVLVAQAGIVKKVSFPREILALAQVGTAMCYFFFQACIMLAFLVGFGVMPDWKYAPVMIFALVCDIVLSAALAVFLSAVTVYLRDVQHLIEVALVAGFFSAPIVYPFATVGRKLAAHGILWVYFCNPLVSIVLSFQRFIYGTVAPRDTPYPLASYGEQWYLLVLGIVFVVSVLLFVLAMLIFGRVEGNFAEEL